MGRESGGVNPYFRERPYILNLKSKSIYIYNIYRAFAGVGDNPPIKNLCIFHDCNAITFQTHPRK